MFKEKYQKDNEKIIASRELINKTRNMMLSSRQKKPVFKVAFASFAVAAIVCVYVFGNFSSTVQNTKSNVFTIEAYALETENGTTTEKKLDFSQEVFEVTQEATLIPTSSADSNQNITIYKDIGFKCEGENIKEIIFNVDEGYFIKRIKSEEISEENAYEFKKVGNSYTLTEEEKEGKQLILWGTDTGKPLNGIAEPKTININVNVTFENGETQEKQIVYNIYKGKLILR